MRPFSRTLRALSRGGSTFTWATFGYDELTLNLAFDGTNAYGAEDEQVIPVLKQVGLPDGSYYTFDYNGYAQVRQVNYYAADDHLLNYIGNDLGDADSGAPTDCPRIGAVSVWAENWNLDTGSSSNPPPPLPVTTTFSTPALADCNRSGTDNDCQETVVTAPDGTEQHTLTRIAGDWDYGLPVLEETWGDDLSTTPTPHVVRQRWVTTTWDQDNTGVDYTLNPRVTDTYIHDSGNTKRTHIGYRSLAIGCGTSCSTDFHLPNSVVEYEADASTVYRTTETDFLESTNYLDRRIIGLPVEKRIYAGTNSGTLMAKTGFYYDDSGFLTAQGSSIPQFDATNYGSTFYYRGNVWKIRQYEIGTSNTKDSKIGYNTTGSVILTRDPLDHDTEISYDDSYTDTTNHHTLAYPTRITDPDGNHSDVVYYLHTGQKTHSYGPERSSGHAGTEMSYTFDSIGRPSTITNEVSDANTSYYYATTGTNVTSYTTIKDLSTYTVASTVTDGAGRTIATATEHPGSSGGYKAQTVKYDILGRPVQTSNWTEINGGFVEAGDDSGGWAYITQTYDWKGRPLVTTNQDTTSRSKTYGGCGCAGGEIVTDTDEVGRKHKSYSDVLGRVVKVEDFEPGGSTVYSTSLTTFDVLDHTTNLELRAGTSGTGENTVRTYDGYGRLATEHTPMQSSGTYTEYSYNADDTVATVTDARGVIKSLTYNDRRLVTSYSRKLCMRGRKGGVFLMSF